MTQAFNLSQLANKLNTSGQLNASTGLSSTVPVANGGTNLSSPGAAGNVLTSNGTAWVSQAASAGFSGANINAASASAITLTSASAQSQVVQCTSVANSIVNLPNATTLTYKGGPIFRVINNSQCNASLFLKDGAGNWIATIPVQGICDITLNDNSTTAGIWDVALIGQANTPAAVISASASLNTITTTQSQNWVMTQMTDSLIVFAHGGLPGPAAQTVACTITGNTFSFGTVVNSGQTVSAGATGATVDIVRLTDTLAILVLRISAWDGNPCVPSYWYGFRCAAMTFAGNAITIGGWNGMNTPSAGWGSNYYSLYAYGPKVARVSATSFAVVYQTGTGTINVSYGFNYGNGNLSCTIGSVSGTTITAGTAVVLSANNGNPMALLNTTDNALAMTYWTSTSYGTTSGVRKAVMILVSGTVPTFGTPVQVDATSVTVMTPSTYSNQWMQAGVAFSATKALLALPYTPNTGISFAYGVFNISSNVITYVAGSQIDLTPVTNNANYAPVLVGRASNQFISYGMNSYQGRVGDNSTTGFAASTMWQRYAINASDVPYLKENIQMTWDTQIASTWTMQAVTVPTTQTSTAAVAAYVLGAPTSYFYTTKVTVPA